MLIAHLTSRPSALERPYGIMVPWIVLLLLALVPHDLVLAQEVGPAVNDFDEGNRRYSMGDFEGALDSYQRAINRGVASGALYYNMGNAYYRLDDIGQAIRYFEKARRIGPDRAELRHNLSIAREQTIDNFSRLPEPFWMPMWTSLVQSIGPTGIFLAGFFCYLVACLALFLWIRDGQKPWRRRLATLGLIAAVCFVSAGFAASAEQMRAASAVVLAAESALYETPSGDSSDLSVHEGLVVEIVSDSGEWTQVRLPNGTRGWLRSEDLGEI